MQASTRARAAHVWLERRRAELEAAERFRRLALDSKAAATPATIVDRMHAAAEDELRHALLCGELGEHFGGRATELRPVAPGPTAPATWPTAERLLYELVALSCVTETLSTAVLGRLVERARDSRARDVMHAILRDEVRHSQIGWGFLAHARAGGVRERVAPHLPALLDSTVGVELFAAATEDEPDAAELTGLGALTLDERRAVVRETLEQVIFPGLERFEIDVTLGRAWLERGRSMVKRR